MTPRELFASLELARARKNRDRSAQLAIAALGARGKEEAIKEQFEEWT